MHVYAIRVICGYYLKGKLTHPGEDVLTLVVIPHKIALLILGSIIQARVISSLQILLDFFVLEVEVFEHLVDDTAEPLCCFDERLLVGTEGLSRIEKIAQHGA